MTAHCFEVKSSFLIQGMNSNDSNMNYYNYDPFQSLPSLKERLSVEVMDCNDSNINHFDSMKDAYERMKKKLETLYGKCFLNILMSLLHFDSVRFYANVSFL